MHCGDGNDQVITQITGLPRQTNSLRDLSTCDRLWRGTPVNFGEETVRGTLKQAGTSLDDHFGVGLGDADGDNIVGCQARKEFVQLSELQQLLWEAYNVFPIARETRLPTEPTHGADTDLHVLQGNDHGLDHRGMLHVVVDGFAQRAFVNGEQRLNPRGVLRLSCQICVVALHQTTERALVTKI